MTEDLENISIVVCVKNSASLLDGSLKSIKKLTPESELIIIDGNSTDASFAIAQKMTDKVYSDKGLGLGHARQLGIDHSTKDFVAFVSPDNRASRKLLEDMRKAFIDHPNLGAVVPQTQLLAAKTYWEKATKYIYDYLINKPGSVEVVGTPCMYRREIVTNEVRYDASITGGCDDTDLSLRLKKAGYELLMIDTPNFEDNNLDLKSFFARHRFYGRGDADFFNKYKNEWTLMRKLRSLFHPLRKYALMGSWTFIVNGKAIYAPALIVATIARYTGWIKRASSHV